jgi:hypothetical protein
MLPDIPVMIKTRNRPGLLALTLASLRASAPGLPAPLIVDDGSDQEAALAYLRRQAPAPRPEGWPADPRWLRHVGQLPEPWPAWWLPAGAEVVEHRRLGIVGGHMHYTRLAAERWPTAEWLLLLEDDALFTAGWFLRVAYLAAILPREVAFLSLYDRHDADWRQARQGYRLLPLIPQPASRWGYRTTTLAGGVAYLVRREAIRGPEFTATYAPDQTAGDAMIQCALARLGYLCATASPSLVQHTGANSLAHPDKPLRYVRQLAAELVWGGEE